MHKHFNQKNEIKKNKPKQKKGKVILILRIQLF